MKYDNLAIILFWAGVTLNTISTPLMTGYFNSIFGTDIPPEPYAGALFFAASACCAFIHIAEKHK